MTVVADLDQALDADGRLVTAMKGREATEDGDDMNRRDVLRDLSTLALIAPLATVESFRQDLTHAIGADTAEQWDEIVAEYAQAFFLASPEVLLRDLLVDVAVVQNQLPAADDRTRDSLTRTAGHLAAITAMTWASLGQHHQARRWWSTARQAGDASQDRHVQVWVRGWEVVNGWYEGRPAAAILGRAAEARAIAGDRADAGTAGLYSGLAQTLATAGHPEAITTLNHVRDLTDRIPAAVAADTESMFGWPEVRLRHTESFVYTAVGDTTRAYTAQDAALALYGDDLQRERAMMLLHRARCMIIDRDVSGGIGYAHTVLDGLATEHHTDLVYALARDTVRTVPNADRQHTAVTDLRERLTTRSTPP